MTRRVPRLLIVDQSLKDAGGHHYEYDLALFRAATARGIPTLIGAHISVPALEHLGETVRPWFQRAWYESYDSPPPPLPQHLPSRSIPARGLRFARRMVRRALRMPPLAPISGFGGEVLALISKERLMRHDHVLVHTFSIPELDSLIELAGSRDELPAIHIILRRDAEETLSTLGGRGGVRGSLTRLNASPAAKATLRLYADTMDLARQHAALEPGLSIGVVPIPHCLPSRPSDRARAEGPLRIVYLGDARDEKGFQHLPDAVNTVVRFFADREVQFVCQANIGAAGDSPMLVAARDRLASYLEGQVQLITEPLSVQAFHALLWSADVVVLPYDSQAYRRRSSGILVQALAAGRVVVVPADTWMATQVDPAAALTFAGPAGLGNSLVAAIQRWPALAACAQANMAHWTAEHDAGRFLDQLFGSK